MAESSTIFTDLYQFVSSTGMIIPQTSSVREDVESVFKDIFGSDFSVETSTPQGRLIEAISLLIVNVVGVNAQNANCMNPRAAVGTYLDAIGKIFGVNRAVGESDDELRKRIVASQSRGSGFVQSIRNAISQVANVTSIYVLENGYSYPMILPNNRDGIAVSPHSVFICVAGGDDTAVAQAIYSAKSAGCGYTEDADGGTLVTSQPIIDASTGSSNVVKFYRPSTKSITVTVSVNGENYTGTDIKTDVASTITALFVKKGIGSRTTQADVITAVAMAGYGASVSSVSFTAGLVAVDYVSVAPYEIVSISSITVNLE